MILSPFLLLKRDASSLSLEMAEFYHNAAPISTHPGSSRAADGVFSTILHGELQAT
jgi:hypothetical protein